MTDRKEILLRAAYDLLRKSEKAPYAESAVEITVYYDDAVCDGYCLKEDIASELDIDSMTEPLKP